MDDGSEQVALVTFDRPPVAEVALSVQFNGIIIDDAGAMNRFWPKIRESYPTVQVQPQLPPMREEFGRSTPGITFQLSGPGTGQRYWFVSSDQSRVVQVQRDRLGFNWRKEAAPGVVTGEYPRYHVLREEFRDVLEKFTEDDVPAGGQQPIANWCDISYINQIPAVDGGEQRSLASILRLVQDVPLPGLPSPEDTGLTERYVLEREGAPYGRMYVQANAGVRIPEMEPIYFLTLTVRAMSQGTSESVMQFMDNGRNLIVRSFRDATTDQMHAEWGLQPG